MNLRFEMAVVGSDGDDLGWLDRVLVNARTRELTHVVIRANRLSEEVLLNLSEVEGNVGGRLILRVADGDLDHKPRYYEGRKSVPPALRVDYQPTEMFGVPSGNLGEAERVTADARELAPSTPVALAEGGVETLVGLGTEVATNRVSEVIVRSGKREIGVPAEWIAEFGESDVRLSATREQLRGLVGAPGGAYISEESAAESGKKKKAA